MPLRSFVLLIGKKLQSCAVRSFLNVAVIREQLESHVWMVHSIGVRPDAMRSGLYCCKAMKDYQCRSNEHSSMPGVFLVTVKRKRFAFEASQAR